MKIQKIIYKKKHNRITPPEIQKKHKCTNPKNFIGISTRKNFSYTKIHAQNKQYMWLTHGVLAATRRSVVKNLFAPVVQYIFLIIISSITAVDTKYPSDQIPSCLKYVFSRNAYIYLRTKHLLIHVPRPIVTLFLQNCSRLVNITKRCE